MTGERGDRVIVAPHAGAWIETRIWGVLPWAAVGSRLTQARGLKPGAIHHRDRQHESRLTQARGLKRHRLARVCWPRQSRLTQARGLKPGPPVPDAREEPSRLTQARGLKLMSRAREGKKYVESRLTQARGLKLPQVVHRGQQVGVAPHAGAWIETSNSVRRPAAPLSRASRRRVD